MAKPTIGLLADADESARACAASIERLGGMALRIDASDGTSPDVSLRLIDALVCCDDAGMSDAAVALLRAALDDDMPIYALGDGMHLLNIAFGGKSSVPLDDHADASNGDKNSDGEASGVPPHLHRAGQQIGGGCGFWRLRAREQPPIRMAYARRINRSGFWHPRTRWEDGAIEALERLAPSLGNRRAVPA